MTEGYDACWDPNGAHCGQIHVAVWDPPADYDGPTDYYQPAVDRIVVTPVSGGHNRLALAHEVGHAIQQRVWWLPKKKWLSCPGTKHLLKLISSSECAWTEGIAHFVASLVYKSPSEHSGVDIETPTHGYSDWNDGGAVEGRILGALIDLVDGPALAPKFDDDAFWDRASEQLDAQGRMGRGGRAWRLITGEGATSLAEFNQLYLSELDEEQTLLGPVSSLQDREAQYFATLFQNTLAVSIFRDPLWPGQVGLRPHAFVPHAYRVRHDPMAWSVVVLAPVGSTPVTPFGYEAELFSDWYLDEPVPASKSPVISKGSGPVFAAVQGAKLAPMPGRGSGHYYPQVRQVLPPVTPDPNPHLATYRIAYDTSAERLRFEPGKWMSIDRSLGATSAPVLVLGIEGLAAGVKTGVRVEPQPGLDVDLYVLDGVSAAATSETALASGTSHGPGIAEQVEFAPAFSSIEASSDGAHYAVVLIARSGSGSVRLHLDQTPPTGDLWEVLKPTFDCPGGFPTMFFVTGNDPETGLLAATYWIGSEPGSHLWKGWPEEGDLCETVLDNGTVITHPCSGVEFPLYWAFGSVVHARARIMNRAGLVTEPLERNVALSPGCGGVYTPIFPPLDGGG